MGHREEWATGSSVSTYVNHVWFHVRSSCLISSRKKRSLFVNKNPQGRSVPQGGVGHREECATGRGGPQGGMCHYIRVMC